MMHAVRGIYRGGVVELLEQPEVADNVEVVVTFLGEPATSHPEETSDQNERLLDDFEPIVPLRPACLSDLVLEGRE